MTVLIAARNEEARMADTILHMSAIRFLAARIDSAPKEVCAVVGSVLVRNSRHALLAKIQEWDYFVGIALIKRLQGLYQVIMSPISVWGYLQEFLRLDRVWK